MADYEETEFDRGYRLGNRDGIEFAVEQIGGRLRSQYITRGDDIEYVEAVEIERIIEAVRNA